MVDHDVILAEPIEQSQTHLDIAGMLTHIDQFIETACAINCALGDRQHDQELQRAKQMLADEPELESDDIYSASICGNLQAVESFLSRDSGLASRTGGPRQWEPLLYLCFSRFLRDPNDPRRAQSIVRVADRLLRAGADPNAYFMLNGERETALYAAVGVANHAPLARLLLENGATVDDDDASYHVAESNDHECIKVMFEFGLSKSHQATVLLRKLDFDDIDGVRTILQLGADPNEKGIWGKTALHQAIMRGRSLDTIRLLVDSGADVNACRDDGMTAVKIASGEGRSDVADYLIGCGAVREAGD